MGTGVDGSPVRTLMSRINFFGNHVPGGRGGLQHGTGGNQFGDSHYGNGGNQLGDNQFGNSASQSGGNEFGYRFGKGSSPQCSRSPSSPPLSNAAAPYARRQRGADEAHKFS